MSSNIRVFVQWKDATVFAGEDIECTITLKNIALQPPADRSPTRRQNGFLAAVERQQRRNPNLRQTSKPSLSRNSSYGPQLPAQHAKGHRPTLSLSTSASTVLSVSHGATNTKTPTPNNGHGRSLSIVSMGSAGGARDITDRNPPPALRRPTRGHGRSASLQVVPGRITGSPHLGSNRAQSATQTPTMKVASPTLSNSRFPNQKKHGTPSTGRRPSGPLSFKFPPGPETNDSPASEGASTTEQWPGTQARVPRSRGPSPKPPQDGTFSGDALSPVARILSGTSMNGTPRSSGEFYSMSNHSSETLPSEIVSQQSTRLLAPAHFRQQSQVPQKSLPETLMMGYAQVTGSFTLDGSLINQAPFEEVKRKGVLGGQGGGGVVGVERSKRDSGLFGALGWSQIGESLGGLLGTSEPSSIREMRGIANSKTVPLLTTPQSILFVDLRLAPGESRTYSYSFTLPRGLPPTHRGRAVKVSYHLAIGTQRSGLANGQQQVRHVEVPFRVFGSVTGQGESLGHDLMSPYIILRDQAKTKTLDNDEAPAYNFSKPSKERPLKSSGSTEFMDYVNSLLDRPNETFNTGLLSPTAETPRRKSVFEEEPQTMKEAIDLAILRSNTSAFSSQTSNKFDIARSGHRVATIMLARPAYRLGETISVVIDFSDADIPCYSVIFCLETSEKVDPAISLRSYSSIYRATRKVHACYSENALYAQRLTFAPTIPPNATPDFITSGVSLEWKLRIEFTTPRLTTDEVEEGTWTDILEEVANDDRGVVLAAAEKLPCESFEVSVPIRIYGAVTGGVENPSEIGLARVEHDTGCTIADPTRALIATMAHRNNEPNRNRSRSDPENLPESTQQEARDRLARGGLPPEYLTIRLPYERSVAESGVGYSQALSISTFSQSEQSNADSEVVKSSPFARNGLSHQDLQTVRGLGATSHAGSTLGYAASLSISTVSQSGTSATDTQPVLPWQHPMPPPRHVLRRSETSSSLSSSKTVESTSSSAMDSDIPSLVTDTETLYECGSEATTNKANSLAGQQVLELGNDGMLERNTTTVYECAFWFLFCHFETHDKEQWLTHCLSHFRGNPPPKKAVCPVCPVPRTGPTEILYDGITAWAGADAWERRMEHVAQSHQELLQSVKPGTADQELFRYLWQKKVINDQDWKDLQTHHCLTKEPAQSYQVTERSVGNRRRVPGSTRRG